MIKIRLFQREDTEYIAKLFHETVRNINIQDYSPAQVKAWAPDHLNFKNWQADCLNQFTYVAEKDGHIVGFGQLASNGHIDCFYCDKAYQRCGIGRQIYQAIHQQALSLGITYLFVEASITALPFFRNLGFTVVKEQLVYCRGERLTNYAMEKIL
jgi:N-acetylglutamate synthase-like GNAT family acetyltransferase